MKEKIVDAVLLFFAVFFAAAAVSVAENANAQTAKCDDALIFRLPLLIGKNSRWQLDAPPEPQSARLSAVVDNAASDIKAVYRRVRGAALISGTADELADDIFTPSGMTIDVADAQAGDILVFRNVGRPARNLVVYQRGSGALFLADLDLGGSTNRPVIGDIGLSSHKIVFFMTPNFIISTIAMNSIGGNQCEGVGGETPPEMPPVKDPPQKDPPETPPEMPPETPPETPPEMPPENMTATVTTAITVTATVTATIARPSENGNENSGGDSSSGGSGAIIGGAAIVGGLLWFLSDGGEEGEFSYSPSFGYSVNESGYSAHFGGRMDFRKDEWTLFYTVGQTNANGEFGEFRYSSGGEYKADFWQAAFSESVRGERADYDLSLSADLSGGMWQFSPVYRIHSRLEEGESETRNSLNLEGILEWNRWKIRPSAGFGWRRMEDFADGGKFRLEAVREF